MLVIGSLQKSEFDIQADLFCRLKSIGLCVRGEVRGTINGKPTGKKCGNKVRLDLVVFSDGVPKLVIETKMKRSNAWKLQYESSDQFAMYSRLELPVVMVCGEREAELLMSSIDWVLGLPNGVHWLQATSDKLEVSIRSES